MLFIHWNGIEEDDTSHTVILVCQSALVRILRVQVDLNNLSKLVNIPHNLWKTRRYSRNITDSAGVGAICDLDELHCLFRFSIYRYNALFDQPQQITDRQVFTASLVSSA